MDKLSLLWTTINGPEECESIIYNKNILSMQIRPKVSALTKVQPFSDVHFLLYFSETLTWSNELRYDKLDFFVISGIS